MEPLMSRFGATDSLRAAARDIRYRLQLAADRRAVREFAAEMAGASSLRQTDFVLDGVAFQSAAGIARVWAEVLPRWSASGFAERVTIMDRGATAPRYAGFQYVSAPVVRAADSPMQTEAINAVCSAVGARAFASTLYTWTALVPSVQSIYDMTPEVLGYDLDIPMWREKHAAIAAADSFVCISHSTDRDLREFLGGAAGAGGVTGAGGASIGRERAGSSPIRTAHLGVAEPFGVLSEADAAAGADLTRELGLPERFYIFIGHRDAYKNADLVFNAARQLIAAGDHEFGLLMLGGGPTLEPQFADVAGAIPVVVTRLDDNQLKLAYGQAAALLYTSRYEGFGLPILEAMACGCPVVTCKNSSIPEVAGDAAVYVDVDDPADLLRAMSYLAEPGVRDWWATAGFKQAAGFSWDDFPRAVAEALEEVAAGAVRATATQPTGT